MTLTDYCPDCWAVIPEGIEHCPFCGYEIQQYHEADYEDKLLAALRHGCISFSWKSSAIGMYPKGAHTEGVPLGERAVGFKES